MTSDLGRFSPADLGPFRLAYGQRWELKNGEGQNIAVSFTPTDTSATSATLYLWWDFHGSFHWAGIYTIKGTRTPPPPKPAVPKKSGQVRCCDGTLSPTCTTVRRGCCSQHGGVCQ